MKPETKYPIHTYSNLEEKLNVWSHFLGLILSVIGLVLLIFRALELENIWAIISFPIFGLSMIILYLASTLYHYSENPIIRYRLNIFDHAAIYVLIAGSYTPFVLVSLNGTEGYVIFSIVWSIALVGIIFKIFYTGRFDILSTILYLAMGWLIIFSSKSLLQSLDFNGLLWLISGGIAYTIGAILYSINKLKLNHAIFHLFVLLGTFCHFISVYFYVIPNSAL
ncbi:PAQR family membrane homeostasis protein TrhA [Kaistella antarctica]|uniref:Hemolysin n=1 Tax=Kaistella antarctica TaxID=266748 RepID=A0A448NQ49_9FLAO|nr:hemolysin III family protein [Kaistella antarctica]KEY19257.1 hemolysin D [Kaistella antarctica]SEW04705.1 hemolysin III [Kaistella antarctica]VEH98600.1 hemolysin [Kaistella antarctica]